MSINKDPWPVSYLVGGDVLTLGGIAIPLWVNYGTKFLWIPFALGLAFTIICYWNAIYRCEGKNKYIEQKKFENEVSEQIKNISQKVDGLEAKVNENHGDSQGIHMYKD